MMTSGDVVVHQSRGVTRDCEAALVDDNGILSIWDVLPSDWKWIDAHGKTFPYDHNEEGVIEPDLIVSSDKWEYIEVDNHRWKMNTRESIIERAKERDDVDEDDIKDAL